MRTLIALAIVALSACTEEPNEEPCYPRVHVVTSGWDDDSAGALAGAIDQWGELGYVGVGFEEADIVIVLTLAECPIWSSLTALKVCAAHELGHVVLGLEHMPDSMIGIMSAHPVGVHTSTDDMAWARAAGADRCD